MFLWNVYKNKSSQFSLTRSLKWKRKWWTHWMYVFKDQLIIQVEKYTSVIWTISKKEQSTGRSALSNGDTVGELKQMSLIVMTSPQLPARKTCRSIIQSENDDLPMREQRFWTHPIEPEIQYCLLGNHKHVTTSLWDVFEAETQPLRPCWVSYWKNIQWLPSSRKGAGPPVLFRKPNKKVTLPVGPHLYDTEKNQKP